MRKLKTLTSTVGQMCLLFTLTVPLFAGLTNEGASARYANLPLIRPITSCVALTSTYLNKVADASGEVQSAEMIDTDKGPFCKVTSHVSPSLSVITYLPAERWTQRYIQGRGGDNAGGANGFSEAGTCQPALNGEFAYSVSNAWFMMVLGDKDSKHGWTPDPQRIIDYAYRGNHVTAEVSKALIKAYYGQPPRYSYFVGCSDGGRQGLIEAQRYPDDFDAVAAGSPGVLTTAEESTFHLWNYRADERADGTNILMPVKVTLLHDAVLAHCDGLSGVKDGLLQDPAACTFDPASMQCPNSSIDRSKCFTPEEVSAITKLYDGAHDDQGNYLYFGLERGSEELWPLPTTPAGEPEDAVTHAMQLAYLILPQVTPDQSDPKNVTFTKADFTRASTRSPLYDAGNTDLKPFSARGGKLILWHGLNDPQIPVGSTIAYYHGLERFMGQQAADSFVRLFLLPGVGHCGGGDGYTEVDMLSALMTWRELKEAPTEIVAGKTNQPANAVAMQNANPLQPPTPYARQQPRLIATRPVYPYPYVAHYTGKDDSDSASSYESIMSPPAATHTFNYKALELIGPDNQRTYEVEGGRVTEKGPR